MNDGGIMSLVAEHGPPKKDDDLDIYSLGAERSRRFSKPWPESQLDLKLS